VAADGGQRPELVLVHGAWHGSWCWEQLVPGLAARGWRTSTVDLPSTSGDPDAGMYADAAVVREHLGSLDGPVTVLAHSYGGLPVTEVAATVPDVTQLIYLAAHMLDVGESLVTRLGSPWFDPAVALLPVPEPARELLFADVPADPADPADAGVVGGHPRRVRRLRRGRDLPGGAHREAPTEGRPRAPPADQPLPVPVPAVGAGRPDRRDQHGPGGPADPDELTQSGSELITAAGRRPDNGARRGYSRAARHGDLRTTGSAFSR
jgi:pimeloyl-ACP methyl ester carboxylesterase